MKYISKYSNDKFVTAQQYITELICEHKALKEKKDLHFRFWTNKEWSLFYRNQIATANKLIEKYSSQAIIEAIKDDRAKKIFSLRAPHLIPIIEEHEAIIQAQNNKLSMEFDRNTQKTYHKSSKQKNTLSRLKELE
jgi:hypothetical protein